MHNLTKKNMIIITEKKSATKIVTCQNKTSRHAWNIERPF
jgi:hypothetical protein